MDNGRWSVKFQPSRSTLLSIVIYRECPEEINVGYVTHLLLRVRGLDAPSNLCDCLSTIDILLVYLALSYNTSSSPIVPRACQQLECHIRYCAPSWSTRTAMLIYRAQRTRLRGPCGGQISKRSSLSWAMAVCLSTDY